MSRMTDETFPWILSFQSDRNGVDTLRSDKTKEVNLTRLKQYMDAVGKNPDELIQKSPLEKILYKFSYEFECEEPACKTHDLMIEDWKFARFIEAQNSNSVNKNHCSKLLRSTKTTS